MAKTIEIFESATNTYTVKDTIGHGGSGSVHLVTDVEGHEFALKRLRPSDSKKQKRFSNELAFCQKEVHKNIVRILDHGAYFERDRKLPFYVMPLYSETLRNRMDTKIGFHQILPVFDQVLSGVEAAHLLGVVHRDLKPENILINASGPLVVADFGIAHFEEEDLFTAVETKDQDRMANFMYAAPEQKDRKGKVDARADIFALGLILNEMFTGTVPLALGYPVIASVAPEYVYLDDVVERMIRHAPGDRHSAIAEVKKELQARGNAFVEQQRLDILRRKVVPAATPDDPLGGQDVEVVGLRYEPPELLFELKPNPPQTWRACLLNLTAPRIIGVATREPRQIQFDGGGRAGLRATENTVEQIVPIFKKWVEEANKQYRIQLIEGTQRRHSEELSRLQKEQAIADEKTRVNKKLIGLI